MANYFAETTKMIEFTAPNILPWRLSAFSTLLLLGTACAPQASAPSNSAENPISKDSNHLSNSISDLDNGDVTWDGTYIGLFPHLSERAQPFSKVGGEPEQAALLAGLADSSKFAICHVLLSFRSKAPFSSGAEQWNGLTVALYCDGSVAYDYSQMEDIAAMWKE